jgi:hypothetical protein
MSPPKEWIVAERCIEEWPEWAGPMSVPKHWSKERVIWGDGIQPKCLQYQFITSDDQEVEDSCHDQHCLVSSSGSLPSGGSGGNSSGSDRGDHSTDSPLPAVRRCLGDSAVCYSPFYPDREWPEWAGHMSPPKEWIDARRCIEEWPEWAGNMSPPEDWDKDRVIMGDGIQPTHLVYQFITCDNEALEDSCHC